MDWPPNTTRMRVFYRLPQSLIWSMPFSNSKIPVRLKLGTVIPIWKKYKKNLPGNYWRITVISVIGQIIWILLREKIALAISAVHWVQSKFQRGFTKNTSPLNAALQMQDVIQDSKQDKKTLCCVRGCNIRWNMQLQFVSWVWHQIMTIAGL